MQPFQTPHFLGQLPGIRNRRAQVEHLQHRDAYRPNEVELTIAQGDDDFDPRGPLLFIESARQHLVPQVTDQNRSLCASIAAAMTISLAITTPITCFIAARWDYTTQRFGEKISMLLGRQFLPFLLGNSLISATLLIALRRVSTNPAITLRRLCLDGAQRHRDLLEVMEEGDAGGIYQHNQARAPRFELLRPENTHAASVNRSSSTTARILIARLPSPWNYEQSYQAILSWLNNLNEYTQASALADEQLRSRAAQRLIATRLHFTHQDRALDIVGLDSALTTVTFENYLHAVWHGIHTDRCPHVTIESALMQLRDALYEIKRGSNLNDAANPVDNGGLDSPICGAGAFNKLTEKMVGVLPQAELIYVTKESMGLSLKSLLMQIVKEQIKYDLQFIRLFEHRLEEVTLKPAALTIIRPKLKARFLEIFEGTQGVSGQEPLSVFDEFDREQLFELIDLSSIFVNDTELSNHLEQLV